LKVAFRVDAIREIGIGHLMRCLALSEELTKRGNICYFLSKIDDALERIIKQYNVNVKKINRNLNLRDDLELLINFSKRNNIDWVITDHYGIDSNYIKNVKQNGFRVLSMDDCAQMYYVSDVVVNQNIGAEKVKIQADENTKLLLGPKYVMLRDELLIRNKRAGNKKVKKILVSLGGVDNDNYTLKILQSIFNNREILVILGPLNYFYNEISSFAEKTKGNIKIEKSPENMADIYLQSDIAVSAGGSSCYELAYFGIPNVIVATADNQIKLAQELDERKISIFLGKKEIVKAEKIRGHVEKLKNDYSLRKSMSQNGKKLIDGKGRVRIVDFMEKID
jgi:UDP-2,4-diacetamido-2,4,6-trideoxy-beta-L-altropyranose hydrolase